MQNLLSGPVAAPTAAYSLAVLRAQLTALTFPSAYLSETEKLLANHHIHECENAEQLARWLSNTPAALAKRQQAHSTLTVSSTGDVV